MENIRENKRNEKDFSRFDHILLPEGHEKLTELGKKLYELASFERLRQASKVKEVEILPGGNGYFVRIIPKDGWKFYELDSHELGGGHRRCGDREWEFQTYFGFDEGCPPGKLPYKLFIREDEMIPEKIKRALEEIDNIDIVSRKEKCPEKDNEIRFDDVVITFPQVKEAIEQKKEEMDPRLFSYSLGVIDPSVQRSWDIGPGDGYFGDPGDAVLKNTCKDFELLNVGGYSTYRELDELKKGEMELFTPDLFSYSSEELKRYYEKLEKTLDKFESPINRKIQEKKISYIKRVYEYVKKEEEKIEEYKRDPLSLEKEFANASEEQPLIIYGSESDLWKLNTFLKGELIEYFSEDFSSKKGKYIGMKIKAVPSFPNYEFSQSIKEGIDRVISFPQDTYAAERIVSKLEEAGYRVEPVGRSGFKSRNKFVVDIPKREINVHKIEYKNEVGEGVYRHVDIIGRALYKGITAARIADPSEIEKIEDIIEEAKNEEKRIERKEFIRDFKSSGDGIVAVMKIGGREKYKRIPDPERFESIASTISAYTRDHRQNMDHTYSEVIIDKEAIERLKEKGRKVITLHIPDELKGIVIGKKGRNIKRITDKFGLDFIRIK